MESPDEVFSSRDGPHARAAAQKFAMTDTPASTHVSAPIEIGAELMSHPPHSRETLVGVVGLVRAAQAAADLLVQRDSLAFLELTDALAEAEISALRLMAEETQISSC